MPLFQVQLREGSSTEEQKKQLIQGLCQVTNEVLSIPPDKIAVLIQELPLTNWGQAGAVATDPNYNELSRRTK